MRFLGRGLPKGPGSRWIAVIEQPDNLAILVIGQARTAIVSDHIGFDSTWYEEVVPSFDAGVKRAHQIFMDEMAYCLGLKTKSQLARFDLPTLDEWVEYHGENSGRRWLPDGEN